MFTQKKINFITKEFAVVIASNDISHFWKLIFIKDYKGETQMRAIFIATGAYGKEVRTGV